MKRSPYQIVIIDQIGQTGDTLSVSAPPLVAGYFDVIHILLFLLDNIDNIDVILFIIIIEANSKHWSPLVTKTLKSIVGIF